MRIEVKETVLGTHQWSKCPHEEVAFLRNEHHHDFTIRASCEVTHEDRELEFILLRVFIKAVVLANFPKKHMIVRFGEMSCEQIATFIKSKLIEKYGEKNWKVSVSEDEIYRGGEW